ncbi:hypothetical protein QEN58_05895 [Halomonas alkaliantarctica]|uniref:Uncharacterized protein n=1 Tax=Halomonas alkaliantarctica TaxID=232346 RepID=A0ABY8LT51_9GAMM|nr:hypothetical protein [Halomonas alkaliantarctica]WGI26589.1 hypothetical protein QEN58_05895 [Halomonas alkaliantarctica]
MEPPHKPQQELNEATVHVIGMENADSLDAFEKHWRGFLHHLERVWNKSQAHFKNHPAWNGWKGQYDRTRRQDPLLSYLINARGADEHTVAEITYRVPGNTTISNNSGRPITITKGDFTGRGTARYEADGELDIKFNPGRTKLLPVYNRGVEYRPPTSHKDESIDPNDVIDVARKGVEFYDEMLRLTTARFCITT